MNDLADPPRPAAPGTPDPPGTAGTPHTPGTPTPGNLRASAALLVLANAVPVIGVAFFDWSLLSLLALYWAENVVIGVCTVVRMMLGSPHGLLGAIGKLIFIGFFCAHYGFFCFGHGIVLYRWFGPPGESFDALYDLLGLVDMIALDPRVAATLAVLAASHLFSLVVNEIRTGEVANSQAPDQMIRPYGRIVALHFMLLLGAGLVQWLGSPLLAVLALIVLKTVIDLWAHRRAHRVASAQARSLPATAAPR